MIVHLITISINEYHMSAYNMLRKILAFAQKGSIFPYPCMYNPEVLNLSFNGITRLPYGVFKSFL